MPGRMIRTRNCLGNSLGWYAYTIIVIVPEGGRSAEKESMRKHLKGVGNTGSGV
jgi:hypothetical protein